jgi:hypothetical protein
LNQGIQLIEGGSVAVEKHGSGCDRRRAELEIRYHLA